MSRRHEKYTKRCGNYLQIEVQAWVNYSEFQIDDRPVDKVSNFKYLGRIVTRDDDDWDDFL